MTYVPRVVNLSQTTTIRTYIYIYSGRRRTMTTRRRQCGLRDRTVIPRARVKFIAPRRIYTPFFRETTTQCLCCTTLRVGGNHHVFVRAYGRRIFCYIRDSVPRKYRIYWNRVYTAGECGGGGGGSSTFRIWAVVPRDGNERTDDSEVY